MDKFIFDEFSAYYNDENNEYNTYFLKTTENYINSLLEARGYVYLNEICTELGLEWNCYKYRNECFIYKEGKRICFNVVRIENKFELGIEFV